MNALDPCTLERIATALEALVSLAEREARTKANTRTRTEKRSRTTRARATDALAHVAITPAAQAAAQRALTRVKRAA